MPLEEGKGKEAFSHNIKAEVDAGKPQKQALAIAYSMMKKARAKKMADGGIVKEEKMEQEPGDKCFACGGVVGMNSGGLVEEEEEVDSQLNWPEESEEEEKKEPDKVGFLRSLLINRTSQGKI